jgi:hypothetical protein
MNSLLLKSGNQARSVVKSTLVLPNPTSATFETVRLDFECQNVLPRLWTVSPNRMALLGRQNRFSGGLGISHLPDGRYEYSRDRAAKPAKGRDISLNHVAPIESNRLLLS